ncbi:Cell wall-associated hydrolase, NlpC family [Lachnospiraceae bacterium]|nr:Cell wall-associated hydrolase, NlpC family [Lachnospiraceae bacterium]
MKGTVEMKYRRVLCVLLTGLLSVGLTVNAAAAKSTSQIKKEQQESQKNLEKAESKASDIKEERDAAQAEVDESQKELVSILANVDIVEGEIESKTKAADEAKEQYDQAVKEEQDQYESMKKRIRYMYEHGGAQNQYLQLFLESSSFADAINRAGYTEELYEYDQKLLSSYHETKEKVKESRDKLQTELDELTEIKDTYEEQSEELKKTIDSQKATVENFSEKLASAQAEAKSYRNEIAKQNEEIRKIAEAEAKALAEKKKKEAEALAKKKAEAEAAKKAAEAAQKKAAEEAAKEASKAASESQKDDEDSDEAGADDDDKGSNDGGGSGGGNSGGGSSSGSATGNEIAAYAQKFLGNPYVAGGTSLTNGTDCSGFTMSVYAHFGYSIPRNSYAQQSVGRGVSYSEAQPGDIVCYAGHVGIYIGNGTICHASTPATGIKLTTATYRQIVTIRRVVG